MKRQIEWQIVVPVQQKADKKRNGPIVSCNQKGLPEGKELIRVAYGQNLCQIKGIKREIVSFWTIDESGSVGRTGRSLGKAITYSAVTQLSSVDYESLFDGIPKSLDKHGHEETHYRDLRRDNPDKLSQYVDRVGSAPFLILSLPEDKVEEDKIKHRYAPKNLIYVLGALNKMVEAIEQVDASQRIIVYFDKTDDMLDEFIELLWTDRVIIRMGESYSSKLLQICDLAASVTGNAINYPNDLNSELFLKLYHMNVNLSSDYEEEKSQKAVISKNHKKKVNKKPKTHERKWSRRIQ